MNFAEDELGDVAGHVRRNAGDVVEGLFADIAHHLFQSFASALVALVVLLIGLLIFFLWDGMRAPLVEHSDCRSQISDFKSLSWRV